MSPQTVSTGECVDGERRSIALRAFREDACEFTKLGPASPRGEVRALKANSANGLLWRNTTRIVETGGNCTCVTQAMNGVAPD
jgi:hypothetical protein